LTTNQANYAAANAFMAALAAARRERGLAGIVLNVGAVIGAGYLQRSEDNAHHLAVEQNCLMHLSQDDFHQLIAEATVAGRPGVGEEKHSEITTGLLEIEHDAAERPLWFSNPKLAHLISQQSRGKEGKDQTRRVCGRRGMAAPI
jgi:hybrid polyketide synthase / nonribosomal peptide synthetase ACE1